MPKYLIKSGDVEVGVDTLAEVLSVVNDRDFHKIERTDLVVTMPGFDNAAVPLVSGGPGKFGVEIAGDHAEALTSLLEPLLPRFFKDGRPLAPWEMGRTQWLALVAVGSMAYNVLPGLDNAYVGKRYSIDFQPVDVTGWLNDYLYSKLDYGHNGPSYKSGHGGSNSRHEVHVAYALATNKPVADSVVEDMLQALKGGFDLSFARAVAERSFLRGRLNVDQLQTLLNVYERECKQKISSGNVDWLVSIAASLGADPSRNDMDDALFRSRDIPALPAVAPQARVTEPVAPSGDLAETLLLQLNLATVADSLARLEDQRTTKQISLRTYEQQLVYLTGSQSHSREASWANRVVAGLEAKDVAFLLKAMDTPDGQNMVSKRFAREHFGLNSLNLRAAERTAAIFSYCGFDAQQQTAWEVQNAEAKRVATATRDAKNARESAVQLATHCKVRDETSTVHTWKELIDKRIAEGFTEMTAFRQGAIMKNYLKNPATGHMMPVQRKDGSLPYAQLAVADRAAAVAAQANADEHESDDAEDAPRVREAQRG